MITRIHVIAKLISKPMRHISTILSHCTQLCVWRYPIWVMNVCYIEISTMYMIRIQCKNLGYALRNTSQDLCTRSHLQNIVMIWYRSILLIVSSLISSASQTSYDYHNGPLTRYVKLRVAHASRIPVTFSPPPRVSDPDMYHGTCIPHVPWCMPGSLTGGFLWSRWRGKRSRHYGARATHNFTYLLRGPCQWNDPGKYR